MIKNFRVTRRGRIPTSPQKEMGGVIYDQDISIGGIVDMWSKEDMAAIEIGDPMVILLSEEWEHVQKLLKLLGSGMLATDKYDFVRELAEKEDDGSN